MRILLLSLVAVTGCTDIVAPAYGKFSGPEKVVTAKMTAGYVNYGGAPLTAWKIDLGDGDGCRETTQAIELEVNTLADGKGLPVQTYPVRAVEAPDALPSALVRYPAAMVTSGSIVVESVTSTLVEGTFTIETAGGELTGEFGAQVCK